jgi:hypothetical protein
MSNLLQLLSLILLPVLLFDLASSASMESSPAKMSFDLKNGEIACRNISVKGDASMHYAHVSAYWSEGPVRSIKDYKHNASEFGLITQYPRKVFLNSSAFEFCVKAEKEGSYYGLMLIEDSLGKIALGVKIELNPKKSKRPLGITGFGILDWFGSTTSLMYFEGIFLFFAFLALIFLMLKIKRKRRAYRRFIK